MMSAPPIRRIQSRYSSNSCPAALNDAPSATNTTEKPTTNVDARGSSPAGAPSR